MVQNDSKGEVTSVTTMLERLWRRTRWFVRQVVQQFLDNDLTANAAALTYTTLFAVVPMMTVTFALFSLLPEFESVGERLQSWVFDNFVPVAGTVVQEKLFEFSERARGLTWIGFAVLIVTAFLMLVTTEKALNSIWHVERARRGLQRFLLYWGVLSLSPLLIASGFLISAYLVSLPLVAEFDVLGFGHYLVGMLPALLSVVGFTVLYFAVPNCYVPASHAFVGGVVTTCLLEVAKNGFRFAVEHMSIEPIYGTFAALPFFLIWLYLLWVIVLIGGIIVRTIGLPMVPRRPDSEPVLLKCTRVLRHLYAAHMRGEAVRDDELNRLVGLDTGQRDRVFEVLQRMNLLVQTDDERWMLARNLRSVTLWQLYEQLPQGIAPDTLAGIGGEDEIVARLYRFAEHGADDLSLTLDELFSAAATDIQTGGNNA